MAAWLATATSTSTRAAASTSRVAADVHYLRVLSRVSVQIAKYDGGGVMPFDRGLLADTVLFRENKCHLNRLAASLVAELSAYSE